MLSSSLSNSGSLLSSGVREIPAVDDSSCDDGFVCFFYVVCLDYTITTEEFAGLDDSNSVVSLF